MRESLPGDDDHELAQLGQAFRDELRAEAEAYEALAAKALLRGRTLAEVAVELLHRGDRVAVRCGDEVFTGEVIDAVGDLVRIRLAVGAVDVDLAGVTSIRVVERVRSGGRGRGGGATSFTARLHEHEAARVSVELGGATLPSIQGRIEAVATDHVVLTEPGGQRVYLRRGAIGWVRPLR